MSTSVTVCIPHNDTHRAYLEEVYMQTLADLFELLVSEGWRPEASVVTTPGATVPELRCALLEAVKTPFVVLLDADDWVEPGYVVRALASVDDAGGALCPEVFFRSWVDPEYIAPVGHAGRVTFPIMSGLVARAEHLPPYPRGAPKGRADAHPWWAEKVAATNRWGTLKGTVVAPITGPLTGRSPDGRGTNISGTTQGALGAHGHRLEDHVGEAGRRHLERVQQAMRRARETMA